MDTESSGGDGHAVLIRLGGIALIVGFTIHIVANAVLKRMPPEDPTLEELRAYLADGVESWALVHGLRYIAIVSIAVFAAGLFARTCCLRSTRPVGWGVLGLLGAGMWLTNLLITNGIETYIFLGPELVASDADSFWALFGVTRVLFTAEIVTWSVFIAGFSVCGWVSGTLPRWLSILGFVAAVPGVLSGVFVVSVMTGGWAGGLMGVAAICGLLWFLCAGVYLTLRGAS